MQPAKLQELSEIALLSAFITISGFFKIPGFIPGSEFQLSAPIAVAICGVFGIKKYLLAGLLASACGLFLGTQTVINTLIALVFRFAVALLYLACGKSKVFYILSGPIASTAARFFLALVISGAFYPLLAAAFPGMLFTALSSGFIAATFEKILTLSGRVSQRL